MKNKKVILAGILAVMMGLSLAGCGNDKKPAKRRSPRTLHWKMTARKKQNL